MWACRRHDVKIHKACVDITGSVSHMSLMLHVSSVDYKYGADSRPRLCKISETQMSCHIVIQLQCYM